MPKSSGQRARAQLTRKKRGLVLSGKRTRRLGQPKRRRRGSIL